MGGSRGLYPEGGLEVEPLLSEDGHTGFGGGLGYGLTAGSGLGSGLSAAEGLKGAVGLGAVG